ncbi:MAG: metallophosphoesterase [Magnetococcales bacterium]|nr:metallophosphoesterase [Magnetococcales bacterium]
MKLRVLVIDDQATERLDHYKIIEGMNDGSGSVELVFPKSYKEMLTMIAGERFDVFLVDVILKTNGWNQSLRDIFDAIGERGPVFLVSSMWDSTAMDEARPYIYKNNVKGLFSWRDFTKEDRAPVLTQLTKAIYMEKKLDPTLRLTPNEKITILHLSDLHFGTTHMPHSKLEWREVKEKITSHWPNGPTFIALTGDITDLGHPDEFKQAKEWLKRLVQDWPGWDLPSPRLLMVPGNHDALLPLSVADHLEYDRSSGIIQWKPSSPESPSMTPYAFTPYLQFANDMMGASDWAEDNQHVWIRQEYRHLGVVFFGINTSQKFRNKGRVEKGSASEDNFFALNDRLRNIVKENPDSDHIVVGLGHHPPFDTSKTDQPACDGYKRLCTLGTPTGSSNSQYAHVPRILLCGHVHARVFKIPEQSSDLSTVTVYATTPTLPNGQRSDDAARGFNMIEISRANGAVTGMKGWSYKWDQTNLEKGKDHEFTRNLKGSFTFK